MFKSHVINTYVHRKKCKSLI